jgi:hypothetical protein
MSACPRPNDGVGRTEQVGKHQMCFPDGEPYPDNNSRIYIMYIPDF